MMVETEDDLKAVAMVDLVGHEVHGDVGWQDTRWDGERTRRAPQHFVYLLLVNAG